MGLTELNGKLRYIQYCRQLKTYGVTFFLVKEKMKGKNKLVPRLLGNHHLNQELLLILNIGFLLFQTLQPHITPTTSGITKENVMRVDERTKEVLQVWQLTTVRRWAASPNSFTLDFGDYSENYYSVQTQVNSCSETSYFIRR